MESKRQKNHSHRIEYIDGNSVRKLNPDLEYQELGRPLPIPTTKKTQRIQRQNSPVNKKIVGRGIDFVSMAFLTIVMGITLFVCLEYLNVQSNMRQTDKTIVSLESELKDIADKNNAAEAKLNDKVDLERIYEIAVGELGMVFPNKNEIINYPMDYHSYMQQNSDIPEITEKSVLDSIFGN